MFECFTASQPRSSPSNIKITQEERTFLAILNAILNTVDAIPEFGLRGTELLKRICEMLEVLRKLVFQVRQLGDR